MATVRAAEAKKRSPVLIQLFPWPIEYADGLLLHAAAEAADKASVPVGVHKDHGKKPRDHQAGGGSGRVRLVLHGGHEKFFKKDLMRKCIAAGMSKVNINGAVNESFMRAARELTAKGTGLTTIIEEQIKLMQAVVEEHMDWLISTGKA